MAVNKVSQREIVEVFFKMPEGGYKPHPALVLSTERLANAEDGIFYAVLISTENFHPEYTMEISNDWLSKPMGEKSYFVTHIVTFFKLSDVSKSNSTFVKKDFFERILFKVIDSIFDVVLYDDMED